MEAALKLKKLEIIGFKSFADRIKIEFSQGITAVVGPNGCGKSNIADAFRWVLGEQSAKSLRGAKMPDVIFAGTLNRKPLNYAEVTITLTDVQGKLPVEYEEIAISRKLHRSGESEYLINKIPVRLKDVQALFLDSSIGKDAYSIFEQGKIDEVINLPPLERRYIFEEASGILRFLQRKKEALRKLEQTDQNVYRVKDIHSEVEKQIIILEEQAEKARQYKERKASYERLEKTVTYSKWEILNKTSDELRKKGLFQDENIAKANVDIEDFQSKMGDAKNILAETDNQMRSRGEDVFSMRSSKEIKVKEKQSHQERLKDLETKERRWLIELETISLKRKEREDERQALQKSHKFTLKSLKEVQESVEQQREMVKVLDSELAKLRLVSQTKQTEMYKLLKTESQGDNQIQQSNLRLEAAQEKQEKIQERKKYLSQNIKEFQQNFFEREKQLQEALTSLDQEKVKFALMEEQLLGIAEEVEKIQNQMDALNLEIGDLRARFKVLQRLKDEMEGFSIGAKKILQAASDNKSPLFEKVKALYEYIQPAKGAETALALALKPYAQTLVVETREDFDSVIKFASQNKVKDVSILCLDAALNVKNTDPIQKHQTLASDIYQLIKPLKEQVVESILSSHFLNEIYTAKKMGDLQQAIKDFRGLEVIIDEGVIVDRKSVVFFMSQGENNAFLREAEIKQLDKKLKELEKDKLQEELVFKAILQKRAELQRERADLDKKIRQEEMKLVGINFNLQKVRTDLQKAEEEDKNLFAESQSVLDLKKTLSELLDQLKSEYAKSRQESIKAKENIEQLTLELEKLTSSLRLQAKDLRDKEQALNLATEENRKQIHSLHVLDIKDSESSQQAKRLEEEIEIGRASKLLLETKKTEIESSLNEVEIKLLEAVSMRQGLETEVNVKKSALENIELKINDKHRLLKKIESERHSTSIQTAQVESNMQMLENELKNKYELTLDQANKEYSLGQQTLDQAEKELKSLKHEIEAAGDINMTSIEEYNKHKTRYEFLNQQIDDLDVSKAELVAIITSLDGESRKLFQETFVKIRANFKKNFAILFNGGEADLQFTESSDVLEAGIEIVAKPPGKQMGSINLLSGGEKCLTAMALLFAIFEVKPAPFCILDEIDAPLDDVNVERFVNIVKLFSESCQFIIITHNKRTMKVADVICGVSMEEKGVSKLLSMNFSNNLRPVMAIA